MSYEQESSQLTALNKRNRRVSGKAKKAICGRGETQGRVRTSPLSLLPSSLSPDNDVEQGVTVNVFAGVTETCIPTNCLAEHAPGELPLSEVLSREIQLLLEQGRWEAARDVVDRARRMVDEADPLPATKEEFLAMPLAATRLDVRTVNALEKFELVTIGDVVGFAPGALRAVPQIQEATEQAIRAEVRRIWEGVKREL